MMIVIVSYFKRARGEEEHIIRSIDIPPIGSRRPAKVRLQVLFKGSKSISLMNLIDSTKFEMVRYNGMPLFPPSC